MFFDPVYYAALQDLIPTLTRLAAQLDKMVSLDPLPMNDDTKRTMLSALDDVEKALKAQASIVRHVNTNTAINHHLE